MKDEGHDEPIEMSDEEIELEVEKFTLALKRDDLQSYLKELRSSMTPMQRLEVRLQQGLSLILILAFYAIVGALSFLVLKLIYVAIGNVG